MRKNIMSGIYCIENSITNKKYIGQSINIDDRWSKHKSELSHDMHDNEYLQNAWNKYGEGNFKFYVLECCNKAELDEKENYYINLHNTLNRNYGYNLKSGGQNGGSQVSGYIRQKQSRALKKAYQDNEDLKTKRKNDALKQWSDPEIKEKITGSNNGMYGKHHTEEAKRKMGEKRIGRPSPQRNTTPVFCIELDRKFDDAVTAAKELSIWSGGILCVCRGERKTCGGYHWKFLLENNIS